MLGLDYNDRVLQEMQQIPLSFYHLDHTHPCYHMPLHWHRSIEILRVLSGCIHVYLNEEKITAAAGDIIFINQEHIHGYSPSDCVYEVIDFDIEELLVRTSLCKELLHLFTNSNISVLPFHPTGTVSLCRITNRLFDYAASAKEENDLLILGSLFELLGNIYAQKHYTDHHKSTEKVKIFKPLLEFIEHNYMKPITLTEMARATGMSASHFSALFRQFFHQTPIDYLNAYRVERACLLLTGTDLTVTEVAYRCGFNDSAYFVKVFKKYKFVTPKKYRATMI